MCSAKLRHKYRLTFICWFTNRIYSSLFVAALRVCTAFLLGAKTTKLVCIEAVSVWQGKPSQTQYYTIMVILLVEPAWTWKGCSLLSSTKYNTCQITASGQWAVPGHTCSAASQKLLDARRGIVGSLKASVQVHKQTFFPVSPLPG